MAWYQKHRQVHVAISAILFATQIIHLIWLGGNAVWPRLFGWGFFHEEGFWGTLIAGVDYLEIPAIVSTSLLYLSDLNQQFSWHKLRLLTYINTQWIHLYWITDEVVLKSFDPMGQHWPVWLAWSAILIDYLEVPVIYDTSKQFITNLANKSRRTDRQTSSEGLLE